MEIGEITWVELEKGGLQNLVNLRKTKVWWKWVWPTSQDSAQLSGY